MTKAFALRVGTIGEETMSDCIMVHVDRLERRKVSDRAAEAMQAKAHIVTTVRVAVSESTSAGATQSQLPTGDAAKTALIKQLKGLLQTLESGKTDVIYMPLTKPTASPNATGTAAPTQTAAAAAPGSSSNLGASIDRM